MAHEEQGDYGILGDLDVESFDPSTENKPQRSSGYAHIVESVGTIYQRTNPGLMDGGFFYFIAKEQETKYETGEITDAFATVNKRMMALPKAERTSERAKHFMGQYFALGEPDILIGFDNMTLNQLGPRSVPVAPPYAKQDEIKQIPDLLTEDNGENIYHVASRVGQPETRDHLEQEWRAGHIPGSVYSSKSLARGTERPVDKKTSHVRPSRRTRL